MAVPQARTYDELHAGAWHIARELRLLSELYERNLRLQSGRPQAPRDEADNDAAVIATLAHLRCLSEFLVGRPKKRETPLDPRRKWRADLDICPEHFVDGWDIAIASSPHTAPLMSVMPLCDQRMSHLSWERLNDTDFYTPTVHHCVSLFTLFVGHLRVRRSTWTDLFLPDAAAASRRCGWPMRFPAFLWFRLPDQSTIQRDLDMNGNTLLRQYAQLLAARLPDGLAEEVRAAERQEDRFFVPAFGACLVNLGRDGQVSTLERELVAEILEAVRRTCSDAGVPESLVMRAPQTDEGDER